MLGSGSSQWWFSDATSPRRAKPVHPTSGGIVGSHLLATLNSECPVHSIGHINENFRRITAVASPTDDIETLPRNSFAATLARPSHQQLAIARIRLAAATSRPHVVSASTPRRHSAPPRRTLVNPTFLDTLGAYVIPLPNTFEPPRGALPDGRQRTARRHHQTRSRPA